MNQERINDYNDKISDWVAKQGFFFQLRHAAQLFGKTDARLPHLIQLFVRVVLLAVLLFVVFLFVLSGWHKKPGFAEEFRGKTKESLAAQEVTSSSFAGSFLGESSLSELEITGGEQSFFETLKIRGLRFNLGIFPILKNSFPIGSVTCSSLDLHLKASATTDREAQRMFLPLFSKNSWTSFEAIEAKRCNLKWGYSKLTRGTVSDSSMIMARHEEGWKISLKGGTFTYGWMKDTKLLSLEATILPDSVKITRLELEKDEARVFLFASFTQLGADPQIAGKGVIRNANLDTFASPEHSAYVTGTINSEFAFEGFVNSNKGLSYTFKPGLNSEGEKLQNTFQLTNSIPLIRALSTLDNTVKYSSYKFNQTQWTVELQNGDIKASEVFLKNRSNDHIALELAFQYSPPQENSFESTDLKNLEKPNTDLSFSLSGKPRKAVESKEKMNLPQRRLFEGKGLFSLSERAFLGKDSLREKYPVNSSGRREVSFALKGRFPSLTQDYSASLYQDAKE